MKLFMMCSAWSKISLVLILLLVSKRFIFFSPKNKAFMKRQITLFYISLIFISSCNFSQNLQVPENQFLVKTKSLRLPLDEKSTYEFYIYQVVGDSLLVLNQVNYSLDVYSLSDQKLIHRIPVEREGVNGLERLNTFYFHNADSIFLFPQFLLKNSLIVDLSGNIVDRIQHNDFNSDIDGLLNHVGTPSVPSILFGNELHFSVYPLLDASLQDGNFITEHSLNLISGDFTSYNYVKKPAYFHDKRWISEVFSRIKTDTEEWYFSWNLSDTVFHIKGENGKLKESISIPMNGGIKTDPQPVPKDKFEEKWPEMALKGYSYGKILLDSKKGVIHRIRYLPTIIKGSKANAIDVFLAKNFEILSYTLSGEFLGSTEFGPGTYDPLVLFLGPDGIYLPKIHPNYEGLQEDEIVYDVFSLE